MITDTIMDMIMDMIMKYVLFLRFPSTSTVIICMVYSCMYWPIHWARSVSLFLPISFKYIRNQGVRSLVLLLYLRRSDYGLYHQYPNSDVCCSIGPSMILFLL